MWGEERDRQLTVVGEGRRTDSSSDTHTRVDFFDIFCLIKKTQKLVKEFTKKIKITKEVHQGMSFYWKFLGNF